MKTNTSEAEETGELCHIQICRHSEPPMQRISAQKTCVPFHTHKTLINCKSNSASAVTQSTSALVPELYGTGFFRRAGSSCSDVSGLQKVTDKLGRSCHLVILCYHDSELCHLLSYTASSLLSCNLIHCQTSLVTTTFVVCLCDSVCVLDHQARWSTR